MRSGKCLKNKVGTKYQQEKIIDFIKSVMKNKYMEVIPIEIWTVSSCKYNYILGGIDDKYILY